MSTQYGTLSHHKTVQVPMWLIVALVVGMLAIAVGYTVEQYQGQGAVATSAVTAIPDTHVTAREGGAVFPATAGAAAVRRFFPGHDGRRPRRDVAPDDQRTRADRGQRPDLPPVSMTDHFSAR